MFFSTLSTLCLLLLFGISGANCRAIGSKAALADITKKIQALLETNPLDADLWKSKRDFTAAGSTHPALQKINAELKMMQLLKEAVAINDESVTRMRRRESEPSSAHDLWDTKQAIDNVKSTKRRSTETHGAHDKYRRNVSKGKSQRKRRKILTRSTNVQRSEGNGLVPKPVERRNAKNRACSSCGSGQICCTSAGSCDPKGANCPANRQKTTVLAQNAAMEAKAATDAQVGAGLQAAHQVKSQLAEKACQASLAAQAALASKKAIVEAIQEQICDAEAVLQDELASLDNLQNAAEMAAQLLCDANNQMILLSDVYQKSQNYATRADELARAMQTILCEKEALMACAQKQVEQLYWQLNIAHQELDDTCESAQSAAKSAQQAKCNAMRNRRSVERRSMLKKLLEREEAEDEYSPQMDEEIPAGADVEYSPQMGSAAGGGSLGWIAPARNRCCGSSGGSSGGSSSGGSCGGSCGGCCPPSCEKANCNVCGANSPESQQQNVASAQCAAQEAEAAEEAQQAAGLQASHQVKTQLAEKACQASMAAQAALAGKQATVDQLQEQVMDAEAVLDQEGSNLELAKCTVVMTSKEACTAVEQLKTLACAMQMAQESICTMTDILHNIELLRDQKAALIEDAKRQIEQLNCQLSDAQQDLSCTCRAAQCAASAAQQAQQSAQRNGMRRRRKAKKGLR